MRIYGLWASVALGLVACSSDEPPNARIAQELTLTDSALVRMQNMSLMAAGDGFTMAGYENGQVRWARLSRDGVLSQETGFALAPPALGPYFAVAKKATPADQLIAIALYPSTTVSLGYDLEAVVQDVGAPTAAAPVVLATLPPGTDKTKVRIAAGAGKSGNLGFVAWGIQVQGYPIKYLLLGANGAPSGEAATAFGSWTSAAQPGWDCLAPTNGPSGLGFSIVGPDAQYTDLTDWVTNELDDAGTSTGEMLYGIPAQVSGCHILGAPTATGGYDIAFEDTPGIGASFYYPPPPGDDTGTINTHPIVLSAASFGDPMQVPHIAWVAPAGNDIAIGLSRASGPYVVRFTYQAVPRGSSLVLRSANGKTGPVSAWTGSDYTYVTYTDQVSGPAGATNVLRYFVKVDASVQLP
jgi:hypothetical protein